MFDEGLPTTLLEIFHDAVDRYSELLITGVRRDCIVDADPDCLVVLKASRSTTQNALHTKRAGTVLPNSRKQMIFRLSDFKRIQFPFAF